MNDWTEADGLLLLAVAAQLSEAGNLVQAKIIQKAHDALSAEPPRGVPLPPLGAFGIPRQ